LASRRSIEHPAQRHAINHAAVHAKSDDPTRALVHHDKNPDRPQDCGFASKQIETPQTVLRMTEQGEPRRPSRVWVRLVPHGENAPNHVLVDGNAECQGDLLRDPWTTPRGIPLFHLDDGGHHFLVGSFWARLLAHRRREQEPIFPRLQRSMQPEER
jgi:hypothetical protein